MASFDPESPPVFTVKKLEAMLRDVLGGNINGTDTEDREYDSIEKLWEFELPSESKSRKKKAKKSSWYNRAYQYWESEDVCPATDDGVLQGFGRLTEADVRDSNLFLNTVSSIRPQLVLNNAADCGAGIGRVTKHLLLHRFQHVDLIEQSPRLLASAPEYLGDSMSRVNLICIGLQDFHPPSATYDVIWIQWVIGHLHDLDCIHFFQRCITGLKPNGVIVLKDNCVEDLTFVVDKSDSSVTRNTTYILLLAKLAGLTLLEKMQQTGFPEELFPVNMFAFVPITTSTTVSTAV